ncbi:zinc finger, CCHC-type containing protein [Tanacetum coccineum]|uniref:Zinc finger, CCHC-type containing protein n=1 Tax=Tanacetum coccineum TaxID=301880 RepID=A0ABQ5EUQ4_9ASTR
MATTMKHMAANFSKLDKFEGMDFSRWQKEMHFFLMSINVVYVLSKPIPNNGDDATMEQMRKRSKWKNDDYVCKSLILNGNEKYFVTFIDDASKFYYIYLLHTKDEALDKFKVFKTKFELQQGALIKRFRIDRVGEYMDTSYFYSVGKIHETTIPHSLQQNGISEKKNRVLKEMVNSILSYSGLSDGFWEKLCYRAVLRLPYPKLKTLGKRGIECIFIGYAEHSKAFRDAIFDENRFSSIHRPSQRSLTNGTDDDEIIDKHSYCFNIEDKPKTFEEGMKPQDVAFWKETINYEMNSIMGNNTWVLADLPPGCKWIFKRKLKIDVKTTFLNVEMDEEVYINQHQGFIMPSNKNKVDLTKEFLSSRFSMKDIREADVFFSTPMDTSEKMRPNNGQAVSQLEYSRVSGCLMYAMTCTKPDIPFIVGKLSRYTSNPSTQHRQANQQVPNNTEANSSTSGWVLLLGDGALSWAYKKQSCITSSTIESEFVALTTAGKEVEWLKNLLLEILLWSKLITPISIHCDSIVTPAKA